MAQILLLNAKEPGLDGHGNDAEQIAVAARIANAALEVGVHIVVLSTLAGSHTPLVREVLRRLRELGIGEIPAVVGGIIPPEGAKELQAADVARVRTPKDYGIHDIVVDLVDLAVAGYHRAG